jgi:hypothetical protein
MAEDLTCKFANVEGEDCPATCEGMVLDSKELCVFDSIAQEHVDAHGTDVKFYHQDIPGSSRDPLYDEPVDREFRGPYKLKAFVEYPPATPEMTENGMRVTWTGSVWVARAALEVHGIPAPLEGDIFQFWDTVEFYKEHSVGHEHVPGAGYYFDVVTVDEDGHVFDSEAFVGFKCEIRRRSEFTPERRLAG